MESENTALLIGATGLVGRYLLQFLLDDPHYKQVKVFTRTSTNLEHPKLIEVVLDFEELAESSSEIVGDDVFCALGITLKKAGSITAAHKVEVEFPETFARLAFQNGAKQFLLVSSLGANVQSKNYYLKGKGEIEERLRAIPFRSLHILRPSLLLGSRKEIRIVEDIGKVLSIAFETFIPAKYKAIKAKTVAKYMILLAKKKRVGVNIHESNKIRQIERKKFDLQDFEEKIYYRDL